MYASSLIVRYARIGLIAALAIAATGCSVFQPRPTDRGNQITARPAAVSVNGVADWSWDVSGDALVRPLQVFSLSGQTYFQMLPRQRIPAIFVDGTPVPFKLAPPYLIVKGVPQRFDLIADGYRALVIHRGPVAMPDVPAVETTDRVERTPDAAAPQASADAAPGTIAHLLALTRTPETRTVPHAEVDVAEALAQSAAVKSDPHRVWRIEPSQQTLSRALAAWARDAGVKLVWKSDVDLPIRRAAEYRDPKFFAAMTSLLADANTAGYQFFYQVNGGVVTVISIKQS